MFCDVKFWARSQIRHDYFHPTIFLHGDIFLFVGQPYELCLTHIFDLYLGTFALLTLPSKTASLWLFCLCSLANPARLYSPNHILAQGHFFICGPPLGVEKAAKICYNVFPRSNICSVMWNLVLARRPARLFSPDHFFARGHFFFVGHP